VINKNRNKDNFIIFFLLQTPLNIDIIVLNITGIGEMSYWLCKKDKSGKKALYSDFYTYQDMH
jgi:hypothetical protein